MATLNSSELSGSQLAAEINTETAERVKELRRRGVNPRLTIVNVSGSDAARKYVSLKQRVGRELGIIVDIEEPAADQQSMHTCITQLNRNDEVHGIIVQLPLPSQIDNKMITDMILGQVRPMKDVDGLGRGAYGPHSPKGFKTAGPAAIMELLQHYGVELDGTPVAVIGRGRTMGKPLEYLLRDANAKVRMFYLPERAIRDTDMRQFDVIIGATNSPHPVITADMVRNGTVVIDATGHPLPQVEKEVRENPEVRCSPPIGGVGPITVSMLLKNTVRATVINHQDCVTLRRLFPDQSVRKAA